MNKCNFFSPVQTWGQLLWNVMHYITITSKIIALYHNYPAFENVMNYRVRATGRHYCQMRRKNIFGTKKQLVAKNKSPLKKSAPKNAT